MCRLLSAVHTLQNRASDHSLGDLGCKALQKISQSQNAFRMIPLKYPSELTVVHNPVGSRSAPQRAAVQLWSPISAPSQQK